LTSNPGEGLQGTSNYNFKNSPKEREAAKKKKKGFGVPVPLQQSFYGLRSYHRGAF